MSKSTRQLSPEQLLHWAEDRIGVMRLNTDRDVLPGGYMAALTPLLVSWPTTEIADDGATVVLRNLCYGGNPFERTTILHSLRFSTEAVEGAELVLVPMDELGRRGPVHHVQVRYIFERGRRGLRELLGISLTLGDSVARETLARLLDAGERDWLAHAPGGAGEAAAERWQALKAKLPRETEVEDRLPSLPAGERTYHVLLRSCATLSRYLILLAVKRLIGRGEGGDYDPSKLPDPSFEGSPAWMQRAATGDRLGLLMRAPMLIRFLLGHPESRPGLLPDALDAAGLLERRDGKRLEIVYARDAARPYGPDGIRREP